ncbi:uncharacterized protein ARMOST_20810 [Armillaria ostoyae]|uniref:Uncharacterized protein n=1 Tax=Armillaria ostoyae TaxID=47428 RepID=A0A284S8D8_ARMOS|nr:uncharacterized protein ARMOST_20810 [Armillaria ostoyae]
MMDSLRTSNRNDWVSTLRAEKGAQSNAMSYGEFVLETALVIVAARSDTTAHHMLPRVKRTLQRARQPSRI